MIKTKIFLVLVVALFATVSYAQVSGVTVSGLVKSKTDKAAQAFVNIVLKIEKDSTFVTGTVSNEEGRFTLTNIKPGNYILQLSYTGFELKLQPVLVGSLSSFLDIGTIELQIEAKQLDAVVVSATVAELSNKMDKKTFSVSDNISQSGGSVLQVLKIFLVLLQVRMVK